MKITRRESESSPRIPVEAESTRLPQRKKSRLEVLGLSDHDIAARAGGISEQSLPATTTAAGSKSGEINIGSLKTLVTTVVTKRLAEAGIRELVLQQAVLDNTWRMARALLLTKPCTTNQNNIRIQIIRICDMNIDVLKSDKDGDSNERPIGRDRVISFDASLQDNSALKSRVLSTPVLETPEGFHRMTAKSANDSFVTPLEKNKNHT